MSTPLLRLGSAASLRERRLAELLAGRSEGELLPGLTAALAAGSLALAGIVEREEDLRPGGGSAAARGLLAAHAAVAVETPIGPAALLRWHRLALGDAGGFRTEEATREAGPPPAPPAFVEHRLRVLEDWLAGDSARQLRAAEAGALALARVVEIRPFRDGNGRVSRLAAAHAMRRAGGRPPLLLAEDGPRLRAATEAAFRLDTEALVRLLEEAALRSVDRMIAALAGPA